MGLVVIACYRPKAGQAESLLSLVREHVPALRGQGLVTERAPIVMRAGDGTVIEIFEWASEEAVERAHHDPIVRELWGRFEQLCEFLAPAQVPGAERPFPHFEPLG